ncbi:acyl-CoA thioester hydrolase/BAAT C-terminal domain-containing protein [Corynebacterium felinum]|uniref:Pimeloyl-ACP methyl ester carboxylesterase n=1 Tax=Corynebacterium felinum TaxID=131318 RepID=A0ABU2B4Z5_9CORY|nr:acyl-CoA thioester hydrolase/BAAT C-terminal domain-containing protein [Corynebacterium felinum]MDF5820313.1 acyl-CoA thioester hydrolase/BAAT C-terminal domain-containing protein [Corynebacterium felinum]MDR7353680.1 pimeloyl-ACP methyl ester carboxylesterase [Corynebacterium felinum]WJY95859.1 hypothetical protein CFELI_11340 [Corynebacterium felinum]
MRTFKKVMLRLAITVLVLFVTILAVRLININRFGDGLQAQPTRDELIAQYNAQAVNGDYLRAIHFPTDKVSKPGTVVVFGGSEGSCNPHLAQRLHEQGYDVLAAYFFGQEGQQPELAEVPLELFDDITAWQESRGKTEEPLTLIGGSKGAELVANLAVRYPSIDNIVLYTPAEYSFFALTKDRSKDQSSWSYQDKPLDYLSFRHNTSFTPALTKAVITLMWNGLIALPPRLREPYLAVEEAAQNREKARIPLEKFQGNALLFAGTEDAMWQGDIAAKNLAELSPSFHAEIYENAGHAFIEDIEKRVGKSWKRLLGGTEEANAHAARKSAETLHETLARWHG